MVEAISFYAKTGGKDKIMNSLINLSGWLWGGRNPKIIKENVYEGGMEGFKKQKTKKTRKQKA